MGILPFHIRSVELHAHRQPALRRTASPSTRRRCRSSSASTPAATRTTRGYDTDTLKSEIIRSTSSPLPRHAGFRVVPEGGNIRFLNTVELQFPIAKSFLGLPLPWGGALFWDMGAIAQRAGTWCKAATSSTSIGISLLRLMTPVGPLSVEYAYPLDADAGRGALEDVAVVCALPGAHPLQLGHPAVAL